MALFFYIEASVLVSLLYMPMQASGNPVTESGQPSLLGSCRFPQSESELRIATQWLVNQTLAVSLQRNAQTMGKELFILLDNVQKATPIPIMKYACQSGYNWACTTPVSGGGSESIGGAGRLRQSSKNTPQSEFPLVKLYASTEGDIDLSRRCEWAHLRPHCVFNSAIFPPILCETDCISTCSGRVRKVDISVIAVSGCDAGQLNWRATGKQLVPVNYNVCAC